MARVSIDENEVSIISNCALTNSELIPLIIELIGMDLSGYIAVILPVISTLPFIETSFAIYTFEFKETSPLDINFPFNERSSVTISV